MSSIFDLIGKSRSIYFFDSVNTYSSQTAVKDLLRMNQESDEAINIFINSPGGNVVDMFAIVDVMKAIKAPINTFVLGRAASAASLIAACGDKRFISPNSEIMIHEAATKMVFDTRNSDSFKVLKTLDSLNEKINFLYSDLTGKSIEEVTSLMGSKEDITMTAQEAINFGLADEMMTNDQLSKIKLSEKFQTIKLSEAFCLEESDNGLKRVHILKAGFCTKLDREIPKSFLKSIKVNFDNDVRGQEISADYTHENDDGEKPAAAWIKELELSEDSQDLYAMMEFTPKGEELIKNKEYKYFSVDVEPLYQSEDGKMFSNVLLGGTLTNRPAVKGLNPIKLSENINNNKIEMELSQEELTSIESIKSEMKLEVKDFYSTMMSIKDANVTLEAEKAELVSNYAKVEACAKEAADALLVMEKQILDEEKLGAVNTLITKGIITNSHKEKVLSKFTSKADIEDFYKDVPAVVSVEAQGADLEDVTVENALKELSEQTGQSVDELKKYGLGIK